MSELIYRIKRWLVHKLGGYMLDECVMNPAKIETLCLTKVFTVDMLRAMVYGQYKLLKTSAESELLKQVRKYIVVDETKDHKTETLTLHLRLRVINDFNGGNNNE